MSEINLEKRINDLERRHEKTRGLLVDALTLAVLGLTGFYFRPEGWYTAIIIGFCVGLFVPNLLSRLFLREGRLTPISSLDSTCVVAAAIGLLILILAAALFFMHPLTQIGG
jgi:hypothetical protein